MDEYISLIPKLTSNNDQGFILTSSSIYQNNQPFYLTGDTLVPNDYTCFHGLTDKYQYIKIEFPKITKAVKLIFQNREAGASWHVNAHTWYIDYSLDDINYTNICIINNEQILMKEYSVIFNAVSFKYIKIYKNDGGYADIGRFRMFKPGNKYLLSANDNYYSLSEDNQLIAFPKITNAIDNLKNNNNLFTRSLMNNINLASIIHENFKVIKVEPQ